MRIEREISREVTDLNNVNSVIKQILAGKKVRDTVMKEYTLYPRYDPYHAPTQPDSTSVEDEIYKDTYPRSGKKQPRHKDSGVDKEIHKEEIKH